MQPHTWRRGRHRITTDPGDLDLNVVHGFLTASYWAAGISRERVARSLAGSILFSVIEDGEPPGQPRQVGFARVISDRTTFAYLADVFILEDARGQGLGVWLIETIMSHPDLQGLRRWFLATRDAHGLYERFGFGPLVNPERMMEYRPPSGQPPSPPERGPNDAQG